MSAAPQPIEPAQINASAGALLEFIASRDWSPELAAAACDCAKAAIEQATSATQGAVMRANFARWSQNPWRKP